LSEIEEAIKSLINLGWSEYESKIYAAVIEQNRSTAAQIAKKSHVPPNRVYQILDRLGEKGIIKKIQSKGGPAIYEFIHPEEVLKRDLNSFQSLITNATDSVSKLVKENSDDLSLRTYTFIGRRELRLHLRDTIKKAQNEILMYVDSIIEIKSADLIDIINERDKKIKMKLLTPERGINDAFEKAVVSELKNVDILITEDAFASVTVIIDSSSLLFVSYAFPYENSEVRDYFGVYIEDRNTSRLFKRSFITSWEIGIKPKIEETKKEKNKPKKEK